MKNIGKSRLICLLCIWLLTAAAWAELQVQVTPNPATQDDIIRLTLSLQTTDDFNEPEATKPLDTDFDILAGPSVRRNKQFINGRSSGTIAWTYQIQAKRQGPLTIPSFKVTNRNRIFVSQPQTINVTAGQPGNSQNQWARVDARVDKTQVYVQEQITLDVTFFTRSDVNVTPKFPDLEKDFLSVNVTNQAQEYKTTIDGRIFQVNKFKILLYPKTTDITEIPPIRLVGRAVISRGSFFDPGRSRSINVGSQAIPIEVLEPTQDMLRQGPWLPAEQLEITETFDPPITRGLSLGEPITRTLTIRVNGQVKDHVAALDHPQTSGLSIYADQAQSNDEFVPGTGSLSTRIESHVLIPEQAGVFDVPPIEIPWFNTQTRRMQKTRTPNRQIRVDAPDQASAQSAAQSDPTRRNLAPPDSTTLTVKTSQTPSTPTVWIVAVIILITLWITTLVGLVVYFKRAQQTLLDRLNTQDAQTIPDNTRNEQAAFEQVLEAIRKAPTTPQAWVPALTRWASQLYQQDIFNLTDLVAASEDKTLNNSLLRIGLHAYANPAQTEHQNSPPLQIKPFIAALENERARIKKKGKHTQKPPTEKLARLSPAI